MYSEKHMEEAELYPLTEDKLEPYTFYENENGCVCYTSFVEDTNGTKRMIQTWLYLASNCSDAGYSRFVNPTPSSYVCKYRKFWGRLEIGHK